MWKSVSGCQTHLFSFLLLESWESVFRKVCWLCKTTLILLKPGWMEVRLSANQNVSLMVFRDEAYSDTPSITAAPGCALRAYSSHRLVVVHLQSALARYDMKQQWEPQIITSFGSSNSQMENFVLYSTVNPVSKILFLISVLSMPVASLNAIQHIQSVGFTCWTRGLFSHI